MSDVFTTLLNLRSLRAAAREEFTLEQLQEALEKLQTVVAEREEAEAESRQAEKEKEHKLNAYREMLIADGIDPEELLATLADTPKKSKRAPRPAKYKYTIDGEERTWTGQGRMPAPVKHAIDNEGKSLEDFLI
ncbi:H-NS family histone-like protein [Photobacterium alginatilyticum]|uniref:DNA-binding protein n=1 Tax=Photobacterium alginatilyticum TaxID=1775171 RepID=A0ABW9YFT4_9GAMM|nr:H-NS family nucleoid-associated regulatory protein [Photobacterium alginatilyticum]NBI52649.1 transcriptional regulator [Photobacterium alginatilyticum]